MLMLPRADSPGGEFVYSETNAATVYIPVAVFLAVCPIIVFTRIWARIGTGGKLGADDYTILLSLAFALVSGAIMLAACHFGYGRHAATLSPDDKYQAFKYFYLCQVTYKASINSTKASILLLYLRIFGPTKWLRWACRFMLMIIVMYCIASVTATIFQCTPVTKAFNKSMKGTCINNGKFWYANAGFSITTDVIILTLPMPLVYALQVPRVQKAALIMVFALGAFVVITSCLRVTTIDLQATSPDPLYDIASTMWTIIEMNVAIVCACLPQIRPLIVKWFPRLMPSHYVNSRERSDKRSAYTASNLSKLNTGSNNRNYWGPEQGNWTRMNSAGTGQDSTNQTSEPSPEEYALEDDKGLQIQKTVQYTVEYLPERKSEMRSGPTTA